MFNGMFNGMFKDITTDKQENYKITKSGNYLFYFENKIGTLTFDINCKKANVEIYGLYIGKNKDDFTLKINQNHTTSNSKSAVLIKSVLDNKSKLNITSTISIKEKGANTDASFINKNLLLSSKTQTSISPQLKVIPGEVQCTHATSTSPLDAKQLQYLIARGINVSQARKLLIKGFINEITCVTNSSQ
jgi:Fe-S cluster assembly protein SufD